jgi:Caspase domain
MLRIGGALALGFIVVEDALADRRVALIIGNAKYEHADTLANTVNDADAITALLTEAGFDLVDERRNVGVVEFKRGVREFLNAASNADIAVVYYSGHGIEIGGVNYLIPVDARLASEFDVDDEAIPVDRIITATESAKKLSLIILDACRDNPFLRQPARVAKTRSIGNRLAGVEPTSTDMLIAYAAKAGSISYDGSGANSPFTTALVKYLAQPGLDIRIALGKVRDDVLANTGNRQEPFVYGSLGGDDVWLVPPPGAAEVVSEPNTDPNATVAIDYGMAERVGSAQAWQAFLAAHNSGYYSNLARAQLAKLTSADISGSPTAGIAAQKTVDLPGAATPQGDKPQQPQEARQNDGRTAALQPRNDVASLTPEQCNADAAKLTQLRRNPSADEVAKFSRELTCEDLRPQVKRFMESLGFEPTKKQADRSVDAVTSATPLDMAQVCKRDADELARIRANPDRGAAARFARDLKCEDLRAQAARLLDSFGD